MALTSDLIATGLSVRQADFLGDTQEDAISATGTTQGTGYKLTKTINRVTTATGGVNDSVVLPILSGTPDAFRNTSCFIRNDSGATINVFPSPTCAINNGAPDAAITMGANTGKLFCRVDGSRWVTT